MGVLVYELINPVGQEIFVGLTSREPSEIGALIKERPPRSIAHWPRETLSPLREIETFESRLEAEKFLACYVTSLHQSGPWKVLCEDIESR